MVELEGLNAKDQRFGQMLLLVLEFALDYHVSELTTDIQPYGRVLQNPFGRKILQIRSRSPLARLRERGGSEGWLSEDRPC